MNIVCGVYLLTLYVNIPHPSIDPVLFCISEGDVGVITHRWALYYSVLVRKMEAL